MVRVEEITYSEYIRRLSRSNVLRAQEIIVRTLCEELERQGKIVEFEWNDKKYHLLDALFPGFGTVLLEKNRRARPELVCAALLALSKEVRQNLQLVSTMPNDTLFVPKLQVPQTSSRTTSSPAKLSRVIPPPAVPSFQGHVVGNPSQGEHGELAQYRKYTVKFFELTVGIDDFIAQLKNIRVAIARISNAVNKSDTLYRVKTTVVGRTTKFKYVFECLTHIIDNLQHSAEEHKDPRKQLNAFIVLGKKETDEYLAAQHILVNILNSALKQQTYRDQLLPSLQEAAAAWSIGGKYVVDSVINLPFYVLDSDEVHAYRKSFDAKVGSIINQLAAEILSISDSRVKERKRMSVNKIISELKLAMNGSLAYVENITRFTRAIQLLQEVSTRASSTLSRIAVTQGILSLPEELV